MGRGLVVGLSGILALSMVACAAESDDVAASEQEHKEGEYVQANSPYFWSDTDYVPPSGFFMAPVEALEESDPIAVRLQAWADRYHELIAAEVKKKTGKAFTAPKPIIKVAKSKDMMNAFVMPTEVALPLWISNQTVKNTSRMGAATLTPTSMNASYGEPQKNKMAFDAKDFISFWNNLAPQCALTAVSAKSRGASGAAGGDSSTPSTDDEAPKGKGAQIVPMLDESEFRAPTGDALRLEQLHFEYASAPASCPGAQSLSDRTQLSMLATSRYVHISTDLIKEMDEDTVAFILAHELGHYYRGHVTGLFPTKYGFWYLDGDSKEAKPLPADEAAEMKEIYLDVTRAPAAKKPLEQKYNARMDKFLNSYLPTALQTAASKNPAFACKAGLDAWTVVKTALATNEAPKKEFAAYEAALESCGATQTLADLGLTVDQARSWGFKKENLGTPATLAELLGSLVTESERIDTVAKSFKRKINGNKVGLYTSEQEADEIALDLAAKVGISFESIQKGWLSFGRMYEKRMAESGVKLPEDSVTMDRCEAMAKEGFTEQKPGNKTRTPVFVPMGDLDEPHHDTCYRLFNMTREMKKHGYTVSAPAEAMSPEWEAIRKEAEDLSK